MTDRDLSSVHEESRAMWHHELMTTFKMPHSDEPDRAGILHRMTVLRVGREEEWPLDQIHAYMKDRRLIAEDEAEGNKQFGVVVNAYISNQENWDTLIDHVGENQQQ